MSYEYCKYRMYQESACTKDIQVLRGAQKLEKKQEALNSTKECAGELKLCMYCTKKYMC